MTAHDYVGTLMHIFLRLCEAKEIAEAAWAKVDPHQHLRNKTRRLIAQDRRAAQRDAA